MTSQPRILLRQAKDFAANSSKASIFVEKYGLSDCIEEEDPNPENEGEGVCDSDESQKAMWVDDIHVLTADHRLRMDCGQCCRIRCRRRKWRVGLKLIGIVGMWLGSEFADFLQQIR